MSIKIVTDSASDVPEALAQKWDITIVPVYIHIGQESFLDGVELSRHAFYERLPHGPYPTTAAPSSGVFTKTYEKLAAEGATEIISIHIATSFSNTYNAARVGADVAGGVSVTVFDTQQVSLGSGLLALAAAEAVQAGHTVSQIMAMLEEQVSRTRLLGMLDTLDALRRSGRANWAEFGLGTLLQIKPILMVYQGEASLEAKVRTRKRALSHLSKLVKEYGPLDRFAIIHANAPEVAAELWQQISPLFPQGYTPITMEIAPALSIHFGLGAVGFACIAKP